MGKKIETMTLSELVNMFRDYGIPCSEPTVAAFIEEGQFPFASCARRQEAGNRNFLIFKSGAVRWLEAQI